MKSTDEFYNALMKLRGTVSVYLDDQGRLVSAEQAQFPSYTKHTFLIAWPVMRCGMAVCDWHMIPDWHPAWDVYIGNREARQALAALTGGKLPNELYQLELLLQPLAQRIPRNGSAANDGPFALTTHADINTGDKLLAALRKLGRDELNQVLHASLLRSVDLSQPANGR